MSIITALLAESAHEGASTLKILERVPADKLEWKPHEKSMSLGQLAWHIATIPGRIVKMLEKGEFDLAGARPGPPDGGAGAAEEFKRNLEIIRERIKQFDEESIRAPFTLRKGEQVLQSMPKVAVLRTIFLNHSIHHRGQLAVYLRLLDVPVPAIYGTSADEAM
jgi:uncharacterized damage-inducible protein DinB